MFGIFSKKPDWDKVKKNLQKRIGRFAVIDWFELDRLLGTNTKKIYIYDGEYVIAERPFSWAEVKFLKRYMPVVDLTKGRPFPEQFEKIPRKVTILGRLNLLDLNL